MLELAYTNKELMAVCCAREIKDGEVVIVGIGMPMMGGHIASRTHAKNAVFVYEAGGVSPVSRRIPWSVGDTPAGEKATAIMEMWRMLGDCQAGFIHRGCLGGAQIDKYGNLNTTCIIGGQSYDTPQVKLPGSGGGNDIGSSCPEITIVMSLSLRKFVKKVDYITTVGHLTGPGSREAAGLLGKGPTSVITDKCIFRFDKNTKEMYLDTLFPGATVEEVKSLVGWDLKIAPNVGQVEPPTQEQLDIIRTLDPKGLVLGAKIPLDDFEEFAQMYESSYKEMKIYIED